MKESKSNVQKSTQEKHELLAQQYLTALYSASFADATSEYLGSNYVEHQAATGFSRSGLEKHIGKKIADYPDCQIVIHRTISQDQYVFLHVEERLSSEESYSRAEWFRFEDGKIVEHWAGAQPVPEATSNGRTMFDGPMVNEDSTIGVERAKWVMDAYYQFIMEGNTDTARSSVTENYMQHNPLITDGKQGLVDFVELLKTDPDKTFRFQKTVAMGDFVVLHSYANAPSLFPDSNVFDIFRLSEDGKLAEHWDIIEPAQSKDDLEKMFLQ